MFVTFPVKNIVSFCVKKSLHFALKICYILRQKLLHFALMLHFASIVTFCGVIRGRVDGVRNLWGTGGVFSFFSFRWVKVSLLYMFC